MKLHEVSIYRILFLSLDFVSKIQNIHKSSIIVLGEGYEKGKWKALYILAFVQKYYMKCKINCFMSRGLGRPINTLLRFSQGDWTCVVHYNVFDYASIGSLVRLLDEHS